MQLETQEIVFSPSDGTTKSVVFSTVFLSIPSVSVTVNIQNVNIFVSNLTTTGCTLNTSAPFAGSVSLIAARG